MTVQQVLQEFGKNWAYLVTLGPAFTERVDFWAGVVSRRIAKKPESFPAATFHNSVYGFISRASSRTRYKDGIPAVPRNVQRIDKGIELPHEEFVEAACWDKTPRTASIIRRLAKGEKIDDIADALGIPSCAVHNAVHRVKGGAK